MKNKGYDEVVTLLLDAKESLREARTLAAETGLRADFEEMITILDVFTGNIQMDAQKLSQVTDESGEQ